MRGEWVREPTGTTSVVFVHGILSSGESCWRHPNGAYWPELLKNEPELQSVGIYVYTYHTGLTSGSYNLNNIVSDLKERFFTLDGIANSQKIVFVSHSMGGIVVRKFIVDRRDDLQDRHIEIGLYLVASPSLGSDYANWLEPISKFAGNAQAQALRFSQDNQWLNDLDENFIALRDSPRLKIHGKELIEDKFITLKFWFRKQVVQPFSGARYFGESYKVPDSNHFSIAKPQDKDAVQHRLLKAFLIEMLPNVLNHDAPAKQVFISYRHTKPDEDLALAIEAALSQEGCQVFLDRKILIGTEWAAEIDSQLKTAAFFIVLLSADSIRSDMVRQEIKLAYELQQQQKLRILPIRVDFTGALPDDLGVYLNPLQYALWQTGQTTQEITETLRLAIRNAKELPHTGRSQGEKDTPAEIQELHDVTEKRGAPLPQIDPRVLELSMENGALACASPFYVRRSADDDIEKILQRRGNTITIKGARQMGKSSLLVRTAAQAKQQGCLVCYIDFQGIDEERLNGLNSLLLYLMHRLAKDLKTPRKPNDYWDEYLGAKDNATDFMEAVLANSEQQVVLMLDEADRVFNYNYRNDFFALLRFWTNRRANSAIWERFDLVVAHATDPVLWIDDINQSPFNVGHSLLLQDFNEPQFNDLAQRYGLSLLNTESAVIRHLIGGHPFLARQALYLLASGKMTLSELETKAIQLNGPFGDHLRRLSGILLKHEPLRRAMLQILQGKSCEDEHNFQRLFTAGLVVGTSRHEVQLRCRLYELYFRANL